MPCRPTRSCPRRCEPRLEWPSSCSRASDCRRSRSARSPRERSSWSRSSRGHAPTRQWWRRSQHPVAWSAWSRCTTASSACLSTFRQRRFSREQDDQMIYGFTVAQVIVACLAGLLCVVIGLAGRRPNDLTLGALVVVELLLLAQLVTAIVSPGLGNHPTGSVPEFYVYLISGLL